MTGNADHDALLAAIGETFGPRLRAALNHDDLLKAIGETFGQRLRALEHAIAQIPAPVQSAPVEPVDIAPIAAVVGDLRDAVKGFIESQEKSAQESRLLLEKTLAAVIEAILERKNAPRQERTIVIERDDGSTLKATEILRPAE